MIPAGSAAYPGPVIRMPEWFFYLFAAVIVLLTIVKLLHVFGIRLFSLAALKLGWRLRRAARVSLAEATDGLLVKVVGTLRYPPKVELLRAPISNRACCYYHVTIDEPQASGKGVRLVTLLDTSTCLPTCSIEADGMTAIVELTGAEVLLDLDRSYSSGALEGADRPPLLDPFLKAQGIVKGGLIARGITCKEGVLQQGERIVVLGRCLHELDPTADASARGYREAPTRLRLVAPADAPLLLSDRRRLTR